MRAGLVQRVIGYSDICIWIVGDHDTVYGRYLWRELCGPLARLRKKSSVTPAPILVNVIMQHTLRSSILVFLILRCT